MKILTSLLFCVAFSANASHIKETRNVDLGAITETVTISKETFSYCSERAQIGADVAQFVHIVSLETQLSLLGTRMMTKDWDNVSILTIGQIRDIVIAAYMMPPMVTPDAFGDLIFRNCLAKTHFIGVVAD